MTTRRDEPLERLREDPVMEQLIERHGPVTVEPAEQPFQRLLVSIINQSISTAAAASIRDRVFDRLQQPITPAEILRVDPQELAEAGLGAHKAETARNAARAFREGTITPAALADCTDAEVVERVCEVDGLGPWTGRMYLLFVLGREDVLPLGDLGVRRGLEQLYGAEDRAAMRTVAEQWKPYRSYGTRYVWKAYESDADRSD